MSKITIHSKRLSQLQGMKYEIQAAKKEMVSTCKVLRKLGLFILLPKLKSSLNIYSAKGVFSVVLTYDSGALLKPKESSFKERADYITAVRNPVGYKMNQIGGLLVKTAGYTRGVSERKTNYSKKVGRLTVGVIGSSKSINIYAVFEIPIITVVANSEIQKVIAGKLLKVLAI